MPTNLAHPLFREGKFRRCVWHLYASARDPCSRPPWQRRPKRDLRRPSSFVIKGVFGFVKLLGADPATADAAEVIRNGACFAYGAADVGRPFHVVADDAVWDNASLSVAVDVNGDGCVSASCSGGPNPADDYLVAGCGGVTGVLPTVDTGVAHTLLAFVRALDVDPSGGVCGATTGTLTLHLP